MTSPAAIVPIEFKRRLGQRSLLPRKQRRKKPSKDFGGIFLYGDFVSVKGKSYKKKKYPIRPSGNGCHHDPDNLKLLIENTPYSKETGKPERVFVKGKSYDAYGNRLRSNAQYKAAKKAQGYYSNPNILPSVGVALQAIKRKKGGGKRGQHRSEGREGVCGVMEILFLNMDVHSLRVGRPDISDKKVFHYHTNATLAAESGLGEKRLQRNLELLEAAGIIGMKRRHEKLPSGAHIGKASAIWFTRDFMKSFDMLNTFNRTSQQLTKRDKQNALRDVKTPEQVKAEATDRLCQAAGALVSKKIMRRDINSLFQLMDEDDGPPVTAH